MDIPVQILREHVMVRVGGGWDTLEHYLDKHDPCRCTSLCESPRPQTPRLPEEGRVSCRSRCFSGPFSRAGGFGTSHASLFCRGMSGFGDFLWLWWPLEVMEDFWMEPDPKRPFAGSAAFCRHPRGAGRERWLGGLHPGVGAGNGGAVLSPPVLPQLTNKPGKPGARSSKCSTRSGCSRP